MFFGLSGVVRWFQFAAHLDDVAEALFPVVQEGEVFTEFFGGHDSVFRVKR
ncbi:MAG: hypothetical protein R3A10_17950 [Caldilineaceae bacterium]